MSNKPEKAKNGSTAVTRLVNGHAKMIIIIALAVAILAIGCAVGIILHGRSVAINGVKYEYSDSLGGYVASAASTDVTGVIVRSQVEGKPVLALADEAFKGCSDLTKVELPSGLIRVGKSAFEGCTTDTDADFDTVIKLINEANEHSVSYIAVTESSDGALAETVASSTEKKDIQILTLNSLQRVNKKDINNGVGYLDVMRENLKTLKTALGA